MNGYRIISMIVENKPGVLFKVSNLIRRKKFNIDSITVGALNGKDISRMVIAVQADDVTITQIAKQLLKLIDVLDVKIFTPDQVLAKELVLVRISSETTSFPDVDPASCRIVESSEKGATVELVGSPEQIDGLIASLEPYGILEVARTGLTAVSRS